MRNLELALKAAADPTRTRILRLLEPAPLCVCQIQAVLGLAPSTVSKHLTILKLAGLVADRREGRWIHYALDRTGRNAYADGVLALVRRTPNREPRLLADRRRLREVRAIPIEDLCGVLPLAPPASPRGRSRRPASKGRRHD
ncbi:MAG: winged helix-turn-helix transcriptional regulator [Candidatus Eisenbacteria bacterium]|nr:winged helix-turn-helix transcriptional regulator [Candidatus Eisenbacteria bacterium]